MSIHLHPTAELAEHVLLPGDPGRALRLAQSLLGEPRMFNHNRGLWGYSGRSRSGLALTIQSTGMGGPSAAIVITELLEMGARTLLRVGTCGALDAALRLGELVVAGAALSQDGTSRALGAAERVEADPDLSHALARLGATPVVAASTDLFYDDRDGIADAWRGRGAGIVEMESATLFALAAGLGARAAALLLVTDLLEPERVRIADDELQVGELALGRLASEALSLLGSSDRGR